MASQLDAWLSYLNVVGGEAAACLFELASYYPAAGFQGEPLKHCVVIMPIAATRRSPIVWFGTCLQQTASVGRPATPSR